MMHKAQKLEKAVFYLFLFLLPFQLRYIVRSWGIGFLEWNAAFFYFTDLLVIALLSLWLLRVRAGTGIVRFQKYDLFFVAFLGFGALSLINAINISLGMYQLIRLGEFFLLYLYVKSTIALPGMPEKQEGVIAFRSALPALFYGGVFQAVLAIIQFFTQGSIGLYILGESVIGKGLRGIASFYVGDELVVRAYGLTPHPNVLATYLFFALFAFIFLFLHKRTQPIVWHELALYGVLLWGFLFTFSRVMIFLFFVGIGLRFATRLIHRRMIERFWEENRKRVLALFITSLVAIGVFGILFWDESIARVQLSRESEAVVLRAFYNDIAFSGSKDIHRFSEVFGVGIGNFVLWLKDARNVINAYLLQPVHNIYLLVLSETGWPGFISFMLFIGAMLYRYVRAATFDRITSFSFLIFFASLLFVGLFDHFLLTLQQGRLMLALVFGFFAAASEHIPNQEIAPPHP